MPVFGADALSDRDLDGLLRYVDYLQHPDNRGGVSLGGFGPVPEGFLVWVLGIGLLLVVCGWIGYRAHDRSAA
jgi:ubiquinol-cytochrome c reductase cytochrome c subunit